MIQVTETASGTYEIDWSDEFATQPVTVSVATDPNAATYDVIAVDQTRRGVYTGLRADTRHYFLIDNGQGRRVYAAQRNISLEGAVNFRDFGGYLTTDSRATKWGRFFRSGHLSRLTEQDQSYLRQLDISTVCDFRRDVEIQNEKSLIPGMPATHHVPITPGARDPDHIKHLFAGTDRPQDVFDAMAEIMRILITEAAPQYKRLFEVMLEHEDGGFLMNCSAGKERTGVGSALVLMALGVPRKTIEYDFMLSGTYYPVTSEVPRVIEKYDVELPGEAGVRLVMPLLETHQAYIQIVFDEIDKLAGSDEEFIKGTYGLTDADLTTLRAKYTSEI